MDIAQHVACPVMKLMRCGISRQMALPKVKMQPVYCCNNPDALHMLEPGLHDCALYAQMLTKVCINTAGTACVTDGPKAAMGDELCQSLQYNYLIAAASV